MNIALVKKVHFLAESYLILIRKDVLPIGWILEFNFDMIPTRVYFSFDSKS